MEKKQSKGIYDKYMSREYKEAWNELTKKYNYVVMFKNLEDEGEENEIKNKL